MLPILIALIEALGMLGPALGQEVLGWIVQVFGWRTGMLACAWFGLLLFMMTVLFVRNSPAPEKPDDDVRAPPVRTRARQNLALGPPGSRRPGWRHDLQRRLGPASCHLDVFSLGMFFCGIANGSYALTFVVVGSSVPRQFTSAAFGFANMAILAVGGLLFQPLIGVLARKRGFVVPMPALLAFSSGPRWLLCFYCFRWLGIRAKNRQPQI